MENINFTDDKVKNFYKLISKNVVKFRKQSGMSQLKLANAIGHQNATFLGKAELLAEDKHFNLEHLYKISSILGIDVSEFLKN